MMERLSNDLAGLSASSHADSTSHSEDQSTITAAFIHGLGWLCFSNLIGVLLALLLLFPELGHWLGEWSYGRWIMVHINIQLYGWVSLPLIAWLFRIYPVSSPMLSNLARAALWMWSLALLIGTLSWLGGNSSGKLFLDWSGYARIFFPLAIGFLWVVLLVAFLHAWGRLTALTRILQSAGLLILLMVPFVLYFASDPRVYPAFNPDTGGPTGSSQLESSLMTAFILLLLPFGLVCRKSSGKIWIWIAWLLLIAESIYCATLDHGSVSHRVPAQSLGFATFLVWAPMIPLYYTAFEWPANSYWWRRSTMAWWALLVVSGCTMFFPGILDRFKFTDGLVAHSLIAMAGFITNLLLFVMVILLKEDGDTLNSVRAFWAWNLATFAYIALFLAAGWYEGTHPAFTFLPGVLRNSLYALRVLLGISMTVASFNWLLALQRRYKNTVEVTG
jgi:cytochrome c oxidase cbb3-type subunit 1